MFFLSSDLSVKLLTVMELQWERIHARVEARPFHALSFRLADGVELTDGDGQCIRCRAGDITLTPAGCSFGKAAREDRIVVVHFSAGAPVTRSIARLQPGDPEHFRQLFERLLQVWSGRQPGYELEARMLFYGILLDMEREWARQSSPRGSQRLTPALNMIRDRLSDGSLSVEELSRACSMSSTYFRKLFAEAMGQTPLGYIKRLRMARITELLRSTRYSIDEISELCGFSSVSYFSLFVKKETGLAPSAYRRRLLNASPDI